MGSTEGLSDGADLCPPRALGLQGRVWGGGVLEPGSRLEKMVGAGVMGSVVVPSSDSAFLCEIAGGALAWGDREEEGLEVGGKAEGPVDGTRGGSGQRLGPCWDRQF